MASEKAQLVNNLKALGVVVKPDINLSGSGISALVAATASAVAAKRIATQKAKEPEEDLQTQLSHIRDYTQALVAKLSPEERARLRLPAPNVTDERAEEIMNALYPNRKK